MKIHGLFLSDLHIGSVISNRKFIIEVLKKYEPEIIVLNGDVIAFDSLSDWDEDCNDILRLLFKRARDGVKVVYIPGNHDDAVRKYCPMKLDNIEIVNEFVYNSPAGFDILFLHGDIFDLVVRYNNWLVKIGSVLYETSVILNRYYNKLRTLFGLDYWSLSCYLKRAAKKNVGILDYFDNAVAEYAKSKGFEYVCAGYIHIPESRVINGVFYMNTGDMCESNSYIISHEDGILELVKTNEL